MCENIMAGRKCDSHWSKKASAVLYRSHQHTVHVWWTCSYCVSYPLEKNMLLSNTLREKYKHNCNRWCDLTVRDVEK